MGEEASSQSHLGGIWEPSGDIFEPSGSNWEPSGRPLEAKGTRGTASRRYLGARRARGDPRDEPDNIRSQKVKNT